METPQIGRQIDSSIGDKEDFGIYAQLRDSDTFRTSLSSLGTVRSHSRCITASLSLHMHGGYYMNVPQRVQINLECAESDDDVRSFQIHKTPLICEVRPRKYRVSGTIHMFSPGPRNMRAHRCIRHSYKTMESPIYHLRMRTLRSHLKILKSRLPIRTSSCQSIPIKTVHPQ